MNEKQYMKKRFLNYLRETRKNKILAMLLLGAGVGSTMIEGDGTFLIFALAFGIPLFFTKENWMY